MPRASKRGKSPAPAKSPAKTIDDSNINVNDLTKIFNAIDKDNSGSIDRSELYSAMTYAYPELHITKSNIATMLHEADTNNDGVLDIEEFINIMREAPFRDDLWGKAADGGLYEVTRQTLQQAANVIESVLEPARNLSRQHSFEDKKTKFRLVTPGMRLVGLPATLIIIMLIFVTLAVVQPLPIIAIFFISFYMIFHGKTPVEWLFGWQIVDDQGNPYGIVKMLFMVLLSLFFSAMAGMEFLFLLCSGSSLSQHIMGYHVIIQGSQHSVSTRQKLTKQRVTNVFHIHGGNMQFKQ